MMNREVLVVNQDALGKPARRVKQCGPLEVWKNPLADGAVALINRGSTGSGITRRAGDSGLLDTAKLTRNLWVQQDMAELKEQLTQRVQSHEVILLKVMPLVLATWPSRARCRMRIWHVANTPRGIDAMWGKGMHPRINGTGIDEQTACGFKSATSADIFAQGHALIQNLRNGFSKLIATVPRQVRFMTAWPQLTQAISLASPGSRSYRSHR